MGSSHQKGRFHSTPDIWLLELSTGILSRFTSDPSADFLPTWSPDGRRLAFASARKGPASPLFQKSVGGTETELLFESEASNWPQAWSRDGDILFVSRSSKGDSLYTLHLGQEAKREPRLLLEDSSGKDRFQLFPDEKWVAYHSNESGRSEVYIAAFPNFSRNRQVSSAGGRQARWRGDSKELFYLQPDGKLVSVEVRAGATLETGVRKVLFQTRAEFSTFHHQYCVTSDGQRFLFIEPAEGKVEPIHVVLNWSEELKRLVPTGE